MRGLQVIRSDFTPRERDFLRLLIEERLSTKECADPMGIAVKTAETHRANIMAKIAARMGVRSLSTGDLYLFAVLNGLVNADRVRAHYETAQYHGA